MEPFTESGMTFGPYAQGHCFRVEQSPTYLKIQANLKIAECLICWPETQTPARIWVVEAKQSSPRPETQPDFDTFINEIKDKLTNALSFTVTAILGRHALEDAELPSLFSDLELATTDFRLTLIINGYPKEWLPPLQDALRLALHDLVKTWALGPNSVTVINHERAKSYGLISDYRSKS